MDRSPRTRRSVALTLGALAGVGLLVALIAPEIVSGTFSDLDTFLRASALVVVLGIWVVAARRLIPHRGAGRAVAAVPVAVALWVVLWPYVRPATEVDEAFPPVAAAPTDTTPAPAAPAPQDDAVGTVPGTTAPTDPSTTSTTTSTTTTASAEPVELARGEFRGLTGHRGSGDAALYRLADGSVLLRFEDVDIGSGPDLQVYVVPGEDRRSPGDGTRVARLTAERGNQNYTPPADVDLTDGTWTVLVWCTTFAVEIANATIAA